MWKTITIISGILAAIVWLASMVPSSPGQIIIANTVVVDVHLSSNLANSRSYHTMFFDVFVDLPNLQTIEIKYPAGFDLLGARLIHNQGIGDGTLSLSGQVFTYRLNSAVNMPAGTQFRMMLGSIGNPSISTAVASYHLDVSFRDSANNVITQTCPSVVCDVVGGLANPFQIKQVASSDILDGSITAAEIATDAVSGDELAGVNNIKFGTCDIDPPSISDNSDLYLHMNGKSTLFPPNLDGSKNSATFCAIGLTGGGRVIAFPPANLDTRLVPKGSTVDCSTNPCHLDVKIRNTAPPSGSFDGLLRTWTWIAFN